MESSKAPAPAEKECFVISPIGEAGTPTRMRADQVLEFVIQEALGPLGYKALRADKISEPGYITIQVLQKLQNTALVIADLTERNANVFYELAALHSMARPAVIHIVDESETIPFDVTGLRLVKFNYKDLKSVGDAKRQIQDHARQIEKGVLGDNPVTLAGMAHKLAASEGQDKLVAQGLGRILEELSELRAEMRASQESAGSQLNNFVWSQSPLLDNAVPLSAFTGTPDMANNSTKPFRASPWTKVLREAKKKKDAEDKK